MRHSISSLIRINMWRQHTTMEPLLILPLLFALVQPATSQVYVNSSTHDGNARASTPKRTDQTQSSLGSLPPTDRTEVPFEAVDPGKSIGATAESVMVKNVSVEVSKEQEHSISNNIEETSTYPLNIDLKVELGTHLVSSKTKGGLTETATARFITTAPVQHIKNLSEKATTKAPPIDEGSGNALLQSRPTVATIEPGTKEPITESSEEDWSSSDVLIPTVVSLKKSAPETMRRTGYEHAQYRPQAQTAYGILTTLSHTQKLPTVNLMLQSAPSTNTHVNEKPTTTPPNVVSPGGALSLADGEREAQANSTVTAGNHTKESSSSSHSPSTSESTSLDTRATNLQPRAPAPRETPASTTNPQPSTTMNPTKPTKATTSQQPKEAESNTTSAGRTDTKVFKSLPPASTTYQQRPKDTSSSQSTSPPIPRGHGPLEPYEKDTSYVEKDMSVSLGSVPSIKPGLLNYSTTYVSKDICDPAPCASPKDPKVLTEPNTRNGSLLVWADLSRTLSFAWELHVFGSAALFLLLTAGSGLGLALAPSMQCPHRGALALANGLLFLMGAVRSAYFLLDPYGSRQLLPLPVVTALYTLPLPLLLWVQAAMVVLVLKGAEVALLPPSFQRPPLLGVLAILQCTLLLASDLLSPALSPAVPVVLQSLTLTAGLVLCLGYLCLVLPRLSVPPAGQVRDKGLFGTKLRVLSRVLAVCALLGALCCLLHAYTCLWLYGLLGDWRRFRWTWWLCQFWARLLELGWAFCLLLLASWVFWRPREGQTLRTSGQGCSAAGDLPSPCQSSSSSHTHTCWAKIVQSLKGHPHRKSDSNGVGSVNGGGVAGELPNNWAGQERSGADISKSLIRNRDPPKESNHGRNQRSVAESSAGSLLRLQALGQPHQCSLSSSLDRDKESAISLYDFDLRPPSPIDLSRSIDEALHREHLLKGGSLFRPLGPPSPPPSPGPWMRRNSDPQITLSDSSDEHTLLTESSAALDRSIPSAVPSRQVTAPPTPTHQGPRWASEAPVPSSVSCPVSLHPSPSAGRAATPSTDDTRPFLTPELDREGLQPDSRGGRSYLKVSRQDDTASVSSDIIDL